MVKKLTLDEKYVGGDLPGFFLIHTDVGESSPDIDTNTQYRHRFLLLLVIPVPVVFPAGAEKDNRMFKP